MRYCVPVQTLKRAILVMAGFFLVVRSGNLTCTILWIEPTNRLFS